jgi:hypothetical protein
MPLHPCKPAGTARRCGTLQWSFSRSSSFAPEKMAHSTHWTGDGVSARADLEVLQKNIPAGNRTPVVQS